MFYTIWTVEIANRDNRDDRSGSLLGMARSAAGLTQEELAELTGMSARAISNLERGRVERPRKSSLEALAKALGMSADQRGTFVAHYRANGGAKARLATY